MWRENALIPRRVWTSSNFSSKRVHSKLSLRQASEAKFYAALIVFCSNILLSKFLQSCWSKCDILTIHIHSALELLLFSILWFFSMITTKPASFCKGNFNARLICRFKQKSALITQKPTGKRDCLKQTKNPRF